ncbi:molybdenum cofactor guanylyltransferase [bacterium]|jgi:molybdopterin-guanine dinucleotide biosynthesis protein A|nr:molybdenum cofactor guanylyltransferase [bacterium]
MNSHTSITGLVLAGGQGRRVGHRDKGLIEWHGRALIAHVCERFRPQVDELIISCNRNHDDYRHYADQLISDTQNNSRGPLAGLEAAIPVVHSPLLAIVPCDIPMLDQNLVKRLKTALLQPADDPVDVSYAHDGERDQYLCVLMRRECLHSVKEYLRDGGRSVRDWYTQQRTAAVDFSNCTASFHNINTLN